MRMIKDLVENYLCGSYFLSTHMFMQVQAYSPGAVGFLFV